MEFNQTMVNNPVLSAIILSALTAAPWHAQAVQYTNDPLNRLTRVTYANGTAVNYTYDAAGNRLTQVVSNSAIPLPAIGVDKSTLTFNAYVGQGDPSPQSLTISNSGGGTLSWTASPADNWVKISPALGTNTVPITVSPSSNGLAVGTFKSSINITSPGSTNNPQSDSYSGWRVVVNLIVTACSVTLSPPGGTTASASGGGGSVAVVGPASCSAAVSTNVGWITITSGSTVSGGGSVAYSVAANAGTQRSGIIAVADQVFTVVQSSSGPRAVSKVGALGGGYWVQDLNGNFGWDGLDIDRRAFFSAGQTEESPVFGDWNGDGKEKLGIYANGTWILDYNGNGQWDGATVDKLVHFGGPGWTPLVGDWSGDGKAKIGAHKDGTWLLDYDGNYAWNPPTDKLLFWGGPGFTPVIGDWNHSGSAKIGVHKEGLWLLDYDGNFAWNPPSDKVVFFGGPGYTPVTGDWNGSGNTKIGATKDGLWVIDYDGNFQWDGLAVDKSVFFGGAGWTPMVGDWDGSGKTKVGAYKDGTWVLDFNGNFTWDTPPDKLIFFGGPGQTPVVGKW